MPNTTTLVLLVMGRQTVERYGAEGITKLQKFYKDVAIWGLRPDQPCFKSQLGSLTCQLCDSCKINKPTGGSMISPMQWGWGRDGDEQALLEDLSGPGPVLSVFLLFFNPLTSLDCWEDEIQPHLVFIASRAALEINKCPINVFCRKERFPAEWVVALDLIPLLNDHWGCSFSSPPASTSGVNEPELMVQVRKIIIIIPFSDLHKTCIASKT